MAHTVGTYCLLTNN